VDVRFTCATRFYLVQEAAEGRFYTDLLYKIRGAQIQLPALRDRLVDIPPLSAFYLRQCRLLPDKPLPVLSE
jgi:DNA-binding NtrC family response regulator